MESVGYWPSGLGICRTSSLLPWYLNMLTYNYTALALTCLVNSSISTVTAFPSCVSNRVGELRVGKGPMQTRLVVSTAHLSL